MPEEYEPSVSAYEEVTDAAIDLSGIDLEESEVDDALASLFES